MQLTISLLGETLSTMTAPIIVPTPPRRGQLLLHPQASSRRTRNVEEVDDDGPAKGDVERCVGAGDGVDDLPRHVKITVARTVEKGGRTVDE